MSRNALYALLTEDAKNHLHELTRQSPLAMLPIPALYIGDSDGEIIAREDAIYVAIPQRFKLAKNPFTGNTSLILTVIPDDNLMDRNEEIGGLPVMDEEGFEESPKPCIFMSDAVHAIPRNYRAFLNSLEETFMRERLKYVFHAEFVVSHS